MRRGKTKTHETIPNNSERLCLKLFIRTKSELAQFVTAGHVRATEVCFERKTRFEGENKKILQVKVTGHSLLFLMNDRERMRER